LEVNSQDNDTCYSKYNYNMIKDCEYGQFCIIDDIIPSIEQRVTIETQQHTSLKTLLNKNYPVISSWFVLLYIYNYIYDLFSV
jgi:hypothetical protein